MRIACTLIALAIGFCAGVAQAQPVSFACPKAGTVEERALGKLQYTGPSPSDPLICTFTNYRNEKESRLYNYYPPDAATAGPIKAGLADLFAGRKASVTFDYTSPTHYISHETWKIARRESVSIGGRTVDTVVFDIDRIYETRNENHFHLMGWLDAKDGLWVKGQSNVVSGQANGLPPSYQDHAITVP